MTSKVAVLVASHNRAELTRRCLESLQAPSDMENRPGPEIDMRVFLTDDGSTDETGRVARESGALVVQGSGNDYWAGGMRRAWTAAKVWEPDVVVLLNDDVRLISGAVPRLCQRLTAGPPRLLGAAVADPGTGAVTYGGRNRRSRLRRLTYDMALPDDEDEISVDVLNGNLLALPAQVFGRLDGLGPYRHGFADYDLSLRAATAGYPVRLAPGIWGTCSAHSRPPAWTDPDVSARERLKRLMRPVQGLPLSDWLLYCRRHGGILAPLYALAPVLRAIRGGRESSRS